MEVTLKPVTNLTPRYWVVGFVLVPFLLLPIPWWVKLIGCITPIVLAGTYRISTIEGDKFRTQLFLGFVPLKPQKCNLPAVLYIETKYNALGAGFGTLLLLGPMQYVFSTIFDMLIPALGGAYEIWLVTAKGREIVAWQGFNQKLFEENVELLTARSGAELRGRTQ
ncbi:hypothetical protein [Schlesneria paludicola]|uniref:hypothetical protein n=1 Tax=Schlesneria paludicola TaxID=360056 RepID=UPI00029A6B48|nr:hypothetical protein [Schlesneria paludicola]